MINITIHNNTTNSTNNDDDNNNNNDYYRWHPRLSHSPTHLVYYSYCMLLLVTSAYITTTSYYDHDY